MMIPSSLPFAPSGKRFYPYFYFLKQRYGGRVAKIPLDGGFTCPNRDGTKGIGGCIYCSHRGSGDFVVSVPSIAQQFAEYREILSQKWTPVGYIPYFQAFTGTYAPPERLRTLYQQALSLPAPIVGLSIATRPDCLSHEVCAVLAEFAAQTDVTVELGVQTVFDDTAARCNLFHTFAEFEQALERLRRIPVRVCVHLIDGLPGESREQMVHSAKIVGRMGVDAVKLHLLHVLRGTALAHTEYACLSQEEYVSIVCDQLEVLPPHMVIERLTGDGKGQDLIAPDWSRNKRAVLAAIDREMKRRDSWQGKYFEW